MFGGFGRPSFYRGIAAVARQCPRCQGTGSLTALCTRCHICDGRGELAAHYDSWSTCGVCQGRAATLRLADQPQRELSKEFDCDQCDGRGLRAPLPEQSASESKKPASVLEKLVEREPSPELQAETTQERIVALRNKPDMADGPGTWHEADSPARYQATSWERITVVAVSVFVVLLVAWVVIRNEPFRDTNIVVLLRILLSLSTAVLGFTIPGFLHIELKGRGLVIRAGGALALFVLTFFFTPGVLALGSEDSADKADLGGISDSRMATAAFRDGIKNLGLELRTRHGLRSARAHFREAAAHDPEFADAHAMIAYCHLLERWFGFNSYDESIVPAKHAVERAIAIDDMHAIGCLVNGAILSQYEYQWTESLKYFERALHEYEANKHHYEWYPGELGATIRMWFASTLLVVGEQDLAVQMYTEAVGAEPSDNMKANVGVLCYRAGDLTSAERYLTQAIAKNPDNSNPYWWRSWLRTTEKRYRDAISDLNTAISLESRMQISDEPKIEELRARQEIT